MLYRITLELRKSWRESDSKKIWDAVDMARVARPIDIAPWLFCTKRGEGYFDEQSGQATHGIQYGSGNRSDISVSIRQ